MTGSQGMLSRIVGLPRTFAVPVPPSRFTFLKRRASRRGSVAIQIGLLMTVLIGMAALGTEIPYLMYKHRQLQTVADSAALGAAMALSKGYPSPISTEAYGIAAALGVTNGAANATVTVNSPPASGNYQANNKAVEVIVTQPQTLSLAGVFGVTAYNVSTRAVAVAGTSGGGYCMLTTDTAGTSVNVWWPAGATYGLSLVGGVSLTMKGCGIAVNAASAQSLWLSGGPTLNAPLVSLAGQMYQDNSTMTVNVTTLNQSQPPVADPYANVAMPSSTGCDYDWYGIGWSATPTVLSPGRYCNGLSIANGATAVLSPGIYYIKSGQFSIAGGSAVTGSGVTIVLTTADGAGSYATLSITNGTDISFSAPTSGPTAGIVFFGDRNAPAGSSYANVISGFNTLNMTGAVYLPTQLLQFGSSGGATSGCWQAIAADILDQLVNMTMDGTCSGTGMSPIGGSSPTVLVE
jgi:Flp pilus assembly protein TadG